MEIAKCRIGVSQSVVYVFTELKLTIKLSANLILKTVCCAYIKLNGISTLFAYTII